MSKSIVAFPDRQLPVLPGIAGLMPLASHPALEQGMTDAIRALEICAHRKHGDLHGQVTLFLSLYRIPSLRGRARPVSFTTTTRYQESLSAFINTMATLNVRPRVITEFTVKHVRMCISEWERQGLSSSTLTNRHTVIRRLFAWAGKENVPDLREMLADPKKATRQFVADRPMDWVSNGVDFDSKVKEIEKTCKYTAMQLRLQRAFGLRSQEALSIRLEESDRHGVLVISRGTKGGKGRVVPVTTQDQRDLLVAAKQVANKRTGLLQRYGLTGEQARKHYYYVLSKHGVTRNSLGVTPHGLRHGYAHERYQDQTGELAPVVAGTRSVSPDDDAARLAISAELGHVRKGISSAYLGAVRKMSKDKNRRLNALAVQLASTDLRSALQFMNREMSPSGYEPRLFVLGPDAEGLPVAPVRALAVGIELHPTTTPPALTTGEAFVRVQMFAQGALYVATGRSIVFVMLSPSSTSSERLEILF